MSTIADCIECAAVFLQMDDVAKSVKKETRTDEQQRIIDELLACASMVIHELASEYENVFATEQHLAQSEGVFYSSFLHDPVFILSVKIDGKVVDFSQEFDRILTSKYGNAEITYAYAPFNLPLEARLPFVGQNVNPRNVAYGIAAEYCIINGMTEQAVLWDRRYKDSIISIKPHQKNKHLTLRKWFL